ncbi:hypothetical protein ACP70R_034509 [Stipagrostis hirtigluma subsp. patula]
MAAVLDALASYVSNVLTDLVKDEVGMLLGVTGEIQKFDSKLRSLKDFLADAERKRITDAHVQGWVGKLKDVMYDATDVMELCQLKAMKRQESMPATDTDSGCCSCSPLIFFLRNPRFTHDIGRRIRELNQRLDEIKKEAEEFNFINLAAYEDRRTVVPRRATRKTAPGFDRSAVVGEKIEDDTRSLVEMVVKEEETHTRSSSNIKVVAIVGVGGIGKTTLAQMIFNNETIEDKFDKRIWLSINQDFEEADLLRTAITAAGGDHHREKELSLLQPTLTVTLAGKKIFLVMDDVWSERAWHDALRIPMTNAAARGTCILITTRNASVARGMKAVQPYHHVNKLVPEDAWCLLKNQVASSENDETAIEMLKNIGLEIIERCDGLPLAIKAIGGLLNHKAINEVEWKKVLNNPSWSVTGMPEDLNHAIYLSYEDLDPPLRQCFMHLSLFPRNTEITRSKIVQMWICEGFIHGSSNDNEEAGEEYFKELILRNLIEPLDEWVDQRACTMHDVVRSFARYVSRDEALVFHRGLFINFGRLDSLKVRRLYLGINGSRSNQIDWSILQRQKSLRTLIVDGSSITFKAHLPLSCFSSLRTLVIIGVKFDAVVDSLCLLKHLRYLKLVSTDISRLPEAIGNMKFLEFIIIEKCEKTVQVPGSIIKLGQLRGFDLLDTKVSGIPRGFGGLTKLTSLTGFPAHTATVGASPKDENWSSLIELGPMSQLRLLEIFGLENVSSRSFAAKANLAAKERLTFLKLQCASRLGKDGLVKVEDVITEEEKQQTESMFDELCPPPCLQDLSIEGYIGRRLPLWTMSSTSAALLKGLRFLFLDDLACCTQLPDGLCQLPYLEFIQINRAPAIKHVGPTFVQAQQHHHSLRCSSGGLITFPRLRELLVIDMMEWEEWEWEAKSDAQVMPLLEVLVIWSCKLRSIPPGLTSHATSLRELHVDRVQHLESLERFTSVTDLWVGFNPDLVRISNLPRLQKLSITYCPELEVLEGVPALLSLKLEDYDMETLPEYLQQVNPRRLELDCSLHLLTSLALVTTGPKWDKISHIQQVKAYAEDGDRARGWYLLYKRDPYSLETNVRQSSVSQENEVDTELIEHSTRRFQKQAEHDSRGNTVAP